MILLSKDMKMYQANIVQMGRPSVPAEEQLPLDHLCRLDYQPKQLVILDAQKATRICLAKPIQMLQQMGQDIRFLKDKGENHGITKKKKD